MTFADKAPWWLDVLGTDWPGRLGTWFRMDEWVDGGARVVVIEGNRVYPHTDRYEQGLERVEGGRRDPDERATVHLGPLLEWRLARARLRVFRKMSRLVLRIDAAEKAVR